MASPPCTIAPAEPQKHRRTASACCQAGRCSCFASIAQVVAAASHAQHGRIIARNSAAGELHFTSHCGMHALRVIHDCCCLMALNNPNVRGCGMLSGMLSNIAGHKDSSAASLSVQPLKPSTFIRKVAVHPNFPALRSLIARSLQESSTLAPSRWEVSAHPTPS